MSLSLIFDRITPMKLFVGSLVATIISILGFFYFGIDFVIVPIILFVAIPLAVLILLFPRFGILVLLVASYFVMFFSRAGVNFPMGTIMDGINLLLFCGFLISQKMRPNRKIFGNSTTFFVCIWIAYNLLQVANPEASSRLAWVYTVRPVAILTMLYFVFILQIKSVEFIRTIVKVWISLGFFAALYAFKQEHFGFADFEQKWLDSDPNIGVLYFIAGHWRKFSIFSDPVSFSYNMVTCAIMATVQILITKNIYKRAGLVLLIIFFLINMVYSGTRGAYVLYPAAILLLAILKLNYKVLIFTSLSFLLLLGLVFAPISNPNVMRFQSAFRPNDDPSFNVRKRNQKNIQPFIRSHPFGGGLGSTGTWGERFAPNSFLAHFPPDSGYVRVAVETGWVGILIFCTMMFSIMFNGIRNYYLIKDPELKSYCLAMVLLVFALNIGNFPQEALVQFPHSVYFYLFTALIFVTYELDKQKQANL